MTTALQRKLRTTCKQCHKRFVPERRGAQFCSVRCRVATHRKRHTRPRPTIWIGSEPGLSTRGHINRTELAERLVEIAEQEDDGEPKTGRRFYYLALSLGYIDPIMDDTEAGRKSRTHAYNTVTAVLGVLRKSSRIAWDAVLDLTREITQWETFRSPREARAELRQTYSEDRWIGQPYYPIFVVEKDTMEPIAEPMARRWQMPFASSRGYSSLRLQYDMAELIRKRQHEHPGQNIIIYFVSDLDPSGLDLQRAWQEAIRGFGMAVVFVRIGLTWDQIDSVSSVHGRPLRDLSIQVKTGDSRSEGYIDQYVQHYGGRRDRARCWETDVLPGTVIEQTLDRHIRSWLNASLWNRRIDEIAAARALL
jgi:hypothetical protein